MFYADLNFIAAKASSFSSWITPILSSLLFSHFQNFFSPFLYLFLTGFKFTRYFSLPTFMSVLPFFHYSFSSFVLLPFPLLSSLHVFFVSSFPFLSFRFLPLQLLAFSLLYCIFLVLFPLFTHSILCHYLALVSPHSKTDHQQTQNKMKFTSNHTLDTST